MELYSIGAEVAIFESHGNIEFIKRSVGLPIAHGCPSLRGFWVMGTAQGLPSLASLTVTSCGVTDLSLEAVGKGCTNIKSMCLRECFVSDGGLVAFAEAAGSLEYLLLEDCSQPC
uniref:EIN3-binding F-box protein 1 n=1 Tax=Solanum tuberosum TaxID=4113 RepID=M1D018_SOLTU